MLPLQQHCFAKRDADDAVPRWRPKKPAEL
jgi:hypothetical protein